MTVGAGMTVEVSDDEGSAGAAKKITQNSLCEDKQAALKMVKFTP